jgi:cytidylate kinase
MVDPKTLRYRNITISGLPGAGSSTLGRGLAKILGWEYFSGGDFMRAYAIKKGLFAKDSKVHHPATIYSDKFDQEVDYGMRQSLKEKSGRILDSWLSGFVAQGIKGVLKILIFCSEDSIRVDRIVNRDRISVEEAKKHIFEREIQNLGKWTRMYKKEWALWVPKAKQHYRRGKFLDFYHPDLYDLAIDTYENSRQETKAKALKALGYRQN